ncbi:hypothetical protein KCU64_g4503, partial [Aureobasidium melanogenum]
MTFLTFGYDNHYLLGALSVLSHHSRVLRAAAKSIRNMERIRGVYFPISRVYYHDKRWDAILTKQYESTSDVLKPHLDQGTFLSSFVHALKHWKPQSISFLTLPGEIRNQIYRLVMPNLGEQYTELHQLNPQASPMRNFSDIPREVRLMVYHLLPLDEEFVFDLKECQQDDDPIDAEHPKSAGLYNFIRGFRDFARFPYLMQFSAIVERSGVEDIVDFEVDDNPDLEYFERNNITHFGKFTCDYETGYLDDATGAASARGRIEVSVDHRRNVTVTGDAECDDTSYDETNWQWFQTFRTEIEDWEESDEEDKNEAQDDEDEDEDQVELDENNSNEQESESGQTDDEDEA